MRRWWTWWWRTRGSCPGPATRWRSGWPLGRLSAVPVRLPAVLVQLPTVPLPPLRLPAVPVRFPAVPVPQPGARRFRDKPEHSRLHPSGTVYCIGNKRLQEPPKSKILKFSYSTFYGTNLENFKTESKFSELLAW